MNALAITRWSRHHWTGLLLASTLAAAFFPSDHAAARSDPISSGCGDARNVDPLRLYGEQMRFSVLRNGADVGFHEVSFERSGGNLTVRTIFDVRVRLLGISVYSYRYEANDVWRDGCLVSMRSNTNDNGTRLSVEAVRDGDQLHISGPKGVGTAPASIFPTHHWHPGVIGSSQVLNTITGTVDRVVMVEHGPQPVAIGSAGMAAARKFAYTGDLTNEVWYDDAGRWVKMRFTAKDGSQIEYRCEDCGVDHTALK
jgi:hypothetical protein